jgi:hypothetical protein
MCPAPRVLGLPLVAEHLEHGMLKLLALHVYYHRFALLFKKRTQQEPKDFQNTNIYSVTAL